MSETWDDLKALAKEFPIGKEVAEYMYEFNADKEQAYIAEQHQKYIMDLTSSRNEVKRMKAALDAALEERNSVASERDTAVSERDSLRSQLEDLRAAYKELEETIKTGK